MKPWWPRIIIKPRLRLTRPRFGMPTRPPDIVVFGMIFKRAPAIAGVTGLILTVPVYGFLQWQFGEIAFLNRMAITFVFILLVLLIITLIKPLDKPKQMPVRKDFDMKPNRSILGLGIVVIVITLLLYVIFYLFWLDKDIGSMIL